MLTTNFKLHACDFSNIPTISFFLYPFHGYVTITIKTKINLSLILRWSHLVINTKQNAPLLRMDTIILLLNGPEKSGKCGMACSRNMTSRVGATGMRRIKSPAECLGADLPKERNLRVFPALFICRLSSRSHLAQKVESPRVLRNTSSGSSRRETLYFYS